VSQLLPTPAARDHKGKSLESRGGGNALPDVTDWGKYAPAIRRWEKIVGRPAPAPTDSEGRLNPALVEFMMGYEEGWVTGVVSTRTGQLRLLGNAIVPLQAATAWAHLLGIASPDVQGSGGGGPLMPTPRTSDSNGAGKHGDGGMDLRTAVQTL
jgi:hypothetical protein